jgi:hypothetical protein
MFQSVQPLPFRSFASVPETVIGSPIMVRANSQAPIFSETLTQPCETLILPCLPSDHGAAWMNCPLHVMRWAKSIFVR